MRLIQRFPPKQVKTFAVGVSEHAVARGLMAHGMIGALALAIHRGAGVSAATWNFRDTLSFILAAIKHDSGICFSDHLGRNQGCAIFSMCSEVTARQLLINRKEVPKISKDSWRSGNDLVVLVLCIEPGALLSTAMAIRRMVQRGQCIYWYDDRKSDLKCYVRR